MKKRAVKALGVFSVLFFLFSLPHLRTQELEPLAGGIFTSDLTVDSRLLETGEPLTLDEATRLALARNLDMQVARFDNKAFAYGRQIAESIYDTEFVMFADYDHDQRETAHIVFGDRQITGKAGFSFEKLIPTGTRLKFEAATQRSSTNSAFTTLPRYYESYGRVDVHQPLLRNAFGYLDRNRIRQVKLNIKQFDLQTLDEISRRLAETRLQYWDLRFAYENLRARRKALRKAQDFFGITRDKLDIGLTEKPDVFAAEANVRKRVLEVLEAENRLQTDSYALRVLLNLPGLPLIYPAERLEFEPLQIDFREELEKAYEARRDLKQLLLEKESRGIEVRMRNNERLPQLDFRGSYASTSLDREMASSQGEVAGFDHPRYFAGFRLAADLENREAGGRYRQAQLGLDSLERRVEKTKITIAKELDQSYRDLLLAARKVRQTQAIEKLQYDKLLEEEKNFQRGRSSSKTIIDFQEDLIGAEIHAIQALLDYKKAVELFYLVTDQLLEKSGVVK